MAFKSSSARIAVLLVLGSILMISGGALVSHSFITYGFVIIAIGFILLLSTWRVYQQTNRSMAFFFDAVRNNDSTLAFPVTKHNNSLALLHQSLNNLNQHIQNVKLEAEVREKYYKSIIRQSATGFVVMSAEYKIELINEAACHLAGINADSSNLNLLKIKNPALFNALCALRSGENSTFKSYHNFSVQQLLLKATEIKSGSRNIFLYSIQDIRQELSQNEIESYQKLISILTHEIMNSLAPLTSISKTLNNIFLKGGSSVPSKELSQIEIQTTIQGLKAIEDQSSGLVDFVTNYRRLTKIPPPVFREIDINEWAEQLMVLFKETCNERNISFEVRNDYKLGVAEGDKNLLNQVLMNIIHNALDALETCETTKKLQIIFTQSKESLLIHIGNNGPAIPPELLEKIFVPFFTTKEKGSGIGLSISSQIIKLHKGTLDVFSDEETGTIFTIKI